MRSDNLTYGPTQNMIIFSIISARGSNHPTAPVVSRRARSTTMRRSESRNKRLLSKNTTYRMRHLCTEHGHRRRCCFYLCITFFGFYEYLLGYQLSRFNRLLDTVTGASKVHSIDRYIDSSELNKTETDLFLDTGESDKPNVTSDDDLAAILDTWWNLKNSEIEFPETDQKVCFVHVGKTAGSTLALYFGFKYPECQDSSYEILGDKLLAPGLLPAATTHMFHTDFNDCADKDFDYYLFVLRDPLKRIQSWFNYEHPDTDYWDEDRSNQQKLLYKECDFDTLNVLGEIGLAPPYSTNASAVCQSRAHEAITGATGFSTHNYYNFGYYLREVTSYTVPTIVVLRTEHLAADWKSIEENVLHGPKDLNVTFSLKCNASPTRPKTTFLSPIAQRRICAALCQEIQVYKSLLQAAINLNKNDVAQSMAELEESCPVEAMNNVCALSF
jgi:hypothetical protein